MRYNHFDMLPDRAFLKVGGRITLEGGGGGGGQTQQTSTAYQTNIPAYLEDPAKRMVSRGETLSEQGYQPYTGERVAGFSPMQQAAFQEIGGLTTPEQYAGSGQAIDVAQRFGTAGALGAMGYGSQALTPEQLTYFQMAQPGTFGTEQAQQYMSPYQQAVTDVAKREATTEAAMLNRELGSKAAKAGAFGGSRFGIEQALLGSKLATNLSDIQTKGLQDAYLNAQQQYERDRAAGMQAGQQNLQAALGVQSLGAQQSLEAQKANEANRLAAAQFNLQGAQFGADTGLKSASQLQSLGTAEQDADLKRIAAQQSAGAQQQALEQQKLDAAYQQYQEQRDWEKNQLGFLSGLIRGTPFSTSQLQSTSAPGATTASQIASLGLGAYGLSSLLGKKDGGAIKMAGGGSVEGYAYGGDVSGLPDELLRIAAAGKNPEISAEDAEREMARRNKLRIAVKGARAEQELAGGESLVDRMDQDGLAALPADNMDFAADGGIIGYADGGVAHFDAGGNTSYGYRLPAGYDPTVYEMFEDPTSGEVYPRKRYAGMAAYGANLRAAAQGKPSPVPVEKPKAAPVASKAEDQEAAPAAPAGPARPPKTYAPVSPGTPAAQIESPLQKMIMERMSQTDKSNAAMAEELAKGQRNVEGIRGDIKGIAALRAAAAIAQGGPGGTIAQLGRGLGAAGEEAQRGVNLIQSAQQGLMGQRLQMAQLERAANAGDVNALATLEQLRQQGPLWAAQAKFYSERDRGGSGASNNLAMLRFQAAGLKDQIKNFGIPKTAADQLKLADLKRRYSSLISMGGGEEGSVNTLPKGAVVAN